MLQYQLSYKNSKIYYCKYGNGSEIVVCLHGYGENAESFTILEPYIKNTHTLIAIDFPFHGQTNWTDGLLFTIEDLVSIIETILESTDPFALVGYSMGGRIALALYQFYPKKIKKMVLIASDGFHHNVWHWLSTQTKLGNVLFKQTMFHPQWMLFFLKSIYKLNLLNKSIYNFVKFYLTEEASRVLLYKRWTSMRKFYTNHHLIQEHILQYQTPMQLVFGKFDKIILTKRGIIFQQKVSAFVSVTEIEAGHQLLKEKYAAQIASFL